MEPAGHRIFISHSHLDNDFGIKLAQDLRHVLAHEDAVFYDVLGGLHGGERWWNKIVEELMARDVFLLILSPDSMNSLWVLREIDVALNENKYIIPILHRTCNIRADLKILQIISFLAPKSYEAAFQEVLGALGLPKEPPITQQDSVRRPTESTDVAPVLIQQIEHQTPTDQNNGKSPSIGISRRRAILGILTLLAGSALVWEIFRSHGTSVQNTEHTCYTSSTIYTGHSNAVWSVAWSLDRLGIASGGADHTVQVWYAANGRLIHTYNGHQPSGVRSLAWSPNNKRIASGGDDKTVKVWDAATGDHVYTYSGHNKDYGQVYSVAWAPNGLHIASGSRDSTVQVWNAIDGSHPFTYREHFDGIRSVAWSPESTRIVSGGRDLKVRVWNAFNGSPVSTYSGHKDVVTAVAWSPNGAYIASAALDKTVEVWEAMTGTPVFTFSGHSGPVTAVAWANDSMHIASASVDKTVQVWNAITGKHICTYLDHPNKVWSVTWSPDGKYIVSAGEDKIVRVWQLE